MIFNRCLGCIVMIIYLLSCQMIQAEEKNIKSIKLPTIVVTPEAYEIPLKQSKEGIQVYTGEQLNALGIETLEAALNLFAPLSYAPGATHSIFIRGMSSGQYQVLIDGVALKDPISTNGAPYISSVLIENIERIEFVSGAKSTLYGSEAMAGVIHIITKKQKKTVVDSTIGEDQYTVSVSGGFEAEGYQLNVGMTQDYDKSLSRLTNTSEKDLNEITNASLFFAKDFGALSTAIQYRTHVLSQDLDSTFGNIDDPNYKAQSRQDMVSLKGETLIGENTKTSLAYSRSSIVRESENKVDSVDTINTEDTRYEGATNKLELRTHLKMSDIWDMSFGIEAKTETGKYNDTRDYGFGETTDEIKEQSQTMYGVYLQESWRYKLFTIKAGGRLETYRQTKSINTYLLTVSQVIPQLNIDVIYRYKTGYREPSIYERFNTYSGKEDLKAEQSKTRELTVAKPLKWVEVSATYFENDVDNLITTISKYDPDVYTYDAHYLNSTELSRSIGGELALSIKPVKNMPFLNLSWARTKARNGSSRSLKVPEERVTVATAFQFGKLTLGASVNHVGEQRSSLSESLAQYTVVNTSGSYNINSNSSAYIRILNLGNTQYEAVKSIASAGREYRLGYRKEL